MKIIRNPLKSWTEQLSRKVESEAKRRGWKLCKKNAEATIVIGGDGTLYYNKDKAEGRIFCIGSKHSWLGVSHNRWMEVFSQNKWKEYLVKAIEVYEGKRRIGWALNDIYLRAKKTVAKIKVSCGQTHSFIGDGIIISTPIGSTAYNFSCGGPMIDWGVDAFAITAIAPHLRSFLPVVYKGRVAISWEGECDLFLDGQRKTIKKNSIVVVEGRQLRMMKYADKRY